MATFSQNNHQLVLVGKDVAKTTGAISAINDGEIALFTPGGTMYTEATADAGDVFGIYLGKSVGTLRSPFFSKADVTKVTRKEYSAPTEQLDFIGSNGTTGSITVLNNTVYRASLEMEGYRPNTQRGGVYVKDMTFESDASATQAEIALGLAGSGIANFSREPEQEIRFRAICDNAGVALSATTGTITATNGSKTILAATDMDGEMAVGDYWREGTATTDDVYEIVAIDTTANTATLDRPYQGTTQVWGATATEYIAKATGDAANWGVSLTGQTLAFTVGKINDKQVRWDLQLDSESFTTTTLLNSASPNPGTGTYRQVAELEYFCNGNNGEIYRNEGRNNFPFTGNAESAETYDVIEIELERGRTDSLGYVNSPQVISLFIDSGKDTSGHYALAATTDDITDMLEDLLDGVPVYGGAVTADGGALTTGDLALT
jgi:hypothetical protein